MILKPILIFSLILIPIYLFSGTNNEVSIFSEVQGNLTINGEHLEGVKLTRTYPELGKTDDITETIYTDNMGNFKFNEVKGKLGIMRYLPHEAVIHQVITAHYLDDEYLLWYTCKRNYKPLGEFKYLDDEPILNPEMSKAYKSGYILLNSDLKSKEDFVQMVDSNIAFISITDFKFPYDLALLEYQKVLKTREDEFTKEIGKWFSNNPDFITRHIEEDTWNEIELEHIEPYRDVVIQGIESVSFSDHISLNYFHEDYNENNKRVTLNGEIILNVINKQGDNFGARIWLSYALFNINKDSIIFEPQDHYFIINSFNIDPKIKD